MELVNDLGWVMRCARKVMGIVGESTLSWVFLYIPSAAAFYIVEMPGCWGRLMLAPGERWIYVLPRSCQADTMVSSHGELGRRLASMDIQYMQAVVVQTWYRSTVDREKFLLGRDGSGTGPATISGPELRTPGRQMQWISGPYYSIASLSTRCTSRLHIELRNMAPTIATAPMPRSSKACESCRITALKMER